MLTFWSSAKQSLNSTVIKPAVTNLHPIPKHQYVSVGDALYVPPAGEVCLAMGSEALELLRVAKLVPKNRSISSLRGTHIRSSDGGTYLVSFHPGVTSSDHSKHVDIAWDIRLADRIMRTGSLNPEIGKYRWVEDFTDIVDAINCKFEKTGKAIPVVLDTETVGLYPYYPDKPIVCIQVTMEEGKGDAVYLDGGTFNETTQAQLEWLLTTPMVKLRGANLKYDLQWLSIKHGIECTNFTFDTLLAGSLLDENVSNSLNVHAKQFTDMGGYDDHLNAKYDKSRMDLIPKDELLDYAAGDSDAALRVSNVLINSLVKQPSLLKFYQTILHPAARAFERIEQRGVLVDKERYAALRSDLVIEIDKLTREALSLIPPRIKAKYSDNLSLTRAVLMRDFFFTHPLGLRLRSKVKTEKTGEPSTAIAHLLSFDDEPKAVAMCTVLKKLSVAQKTLSTFCDGFLEHLRPDGRFHATWYLAHVNMEGTETGAGSTTGRTSCKNPGLQLIPKKTFWAKRIRECFIAPPGMEMLNVDFQQGELRVVASYAPEPSMIEAYIAGKDLHAVTAARTNGYSYEEFMALKKVDPEKFKLLRDKAKSGNFGLLYSMSATGFVAYAWASYQLKLTLDEAEQFRNNFLNHAYPALPAWHKREKESARKLGYVVNPFGRVRHLPLINSRDSMVRGDSERAAINYPIQSCLNDMMLWGISLLDKQYPDLQIVMDTHDAITCYVPEDTSATWASRIKDVLENLPYKEVFGWDSALNYPVDAEAGPDLAHLTAIP